ncbi:LacI family transcriptional regulator [Microlunatus elymi]|uniref:LacI family transcriptional regulator n=1 Tax=Microlunatus elymi TaxID=2596828 RepID=A0A516PUJ1_9ACTN|nr:LacI family DNA-binding transcriptional regulator [Microlunatus elymi]QDP94864.1 LacI family transcriptional regulator [Microlunatus elymi]
MQKGRARRPTIADVADRAGVSKGAVSFALNGSPGVSEQTRERIKKAADDLGWHPHHAARSLRQSRAESVGMIVNRPMRTLGVEPFYAQLSSGLSAELAEHGISLQTFIVGSVEEELASYRRWWLERRVDGFVLMDPTPDDPRTAALNDLELPGVVIGEPETAGGLSSVWADDTAAMRSCLDHLVGLGHRRIAHVCGTASYLHTQRRIRVLRNARRRGDLEWTRSLATDYSDHQSSDLTRKLLAGDFGATAVIYDSDVMALAGLAALQESGIAVPEEMSLVSFDDSPLTRLTHPPLTALHRDTFEFGSIVARTLIESMAQRKPVTVQAPTPELVVRGSTAAPAAPVSRVRR